MTLSTPRFGLVGRRGCYLLAGLLLVVVLIYSYHYLRKPREADEQLDLDDDPDDEPDETDEQRPDQKQLPPNSKSANSSAPDSASASRSRPPKITRSSKRVKSTAPPNSSHTANLTSGRRSCSPPKFLSYDELEALVNATGGAARGRLVHHSWKTPALPPRFWRYSSTWCECFNAWPQVLWTDEDNARFVRDKFAWFYDVFREFAYPINRLDTLRYLYLAEYGGLYTDLDNLCLRPFEHLLHGYGIVYGDMAAGQYQNRPFHFVQNSMMYSRPGHPFWLVLAKSLRGQQHRHDVIGSIHMMNILHTVWDEYNNGSAARTSIVPIPSPDKVAAIPPVPPYNPADAQPLAVGVYAGHVFNPVSYLAHRVSPCRDFNEMNDAQLRECIAFHTANSETHVLQVHTQSWGRGMHTVNRN